jgi:RHS repeat-associated protein
VETWISKRALSTVICGALVCTLAGVVPAVAVAAAAASPPAPRERSVPGQVAGAAAVPTDPAQEKAVRSAPVVTWPAPGSAEIDLPRSSVASAGVVSRARVGELPVYVGAPSSPTIAGVAAPARVGVDLLGRRDDALLLRVRRTDGVARAASMSLEVEYAGFRDAYGGDWATRLHLVALPECAALTPQRPECRGTPVGTRNNGSGRLSGDVTLDAAGAGLFAVAPTAAGTAGDFGESSLSPSSTWQAGGPSGDFSWQYPMSVPPSLGGPAPELALAYSSGNVDGRTTGTNNQPSWVGEGFEFSPGGFIERRYTSCAADMKNGANNTTKTGDLCWASDNLTFSLNGHGGELILDSTTGVWRPRVDDGSRVERLRDTSLGNGDTDGEYWRITTRAGVQFYFGLNKLPGWSLTTHPQTKSVWTVPVYGNHAGEPCHQSTFDASSCPQAWRWNLDYIVDPHGDTASFFYEKETNNYARNLTASKVSTYTRGGYPLRIEYGQRTGEVYTKPWVGRVLFEVGDRCLPGSTCTTAQPANWPDVPWDRACSSTTSCPNKFNPTFWTQKRLAKVTTQVWGGTAARDVSSWTFTHTYPNPGDGTQPRLWLNSVQQTGLAGGTLALPPVTFEGTQLANRVDGADHIPAMNWWRLKAVRTEAGNEIRVNYSEKDCVYGTGLPAPATNGKRCHPVRWTPDGLAELTDWFNKYVVLEVSESDRTTGLDPEISAVEYVGPAAWRHDEEDGLVPETRKTWSQWRGYERVRVRKGRPNQPKSLTETVYFRGMDGDKTATAGVLKDVAIRDSTNTAWDDTDQFAGLTRETITYTADGGTMLSRSITDPWLSAPTATRTRSWGTTSAYQVQERRLVQGETTGGRWRETASTHTYGADGTLLESADQGDLVDPNDDKCTRYSYARNQTAWLLDLPSQRRISVGSCATAPASADDVVSDERYYYDLSDTLGAAPARGDLTRREEISGWAGGAASYLTTMRAKYDQHGRLTERTDVNNTLERYAYTPAVAAPTTKVAVTNAMGHVSTTELDPAWGSEVSVTAPNGKRGDATYDPLGRLVKAWEPGRDKATQTPSASYQYVVRNDGPNVVIASVLESNGVYRDEYKLLDGKMRLRQTQTSSPRGGRVIADEVYDSRGRKIKENGPYYNDAPPGTALFLPDEALLPAQTVTVYDGADRAAAEIFLVEGVEKWRTSYAYEIDREHITPPAGDTPVTRILDAQGRMVELRQYQGTTPTGGYDATRYAYTRRGELSSVTDAAGNVWRYFYDARGRKIRTEDPDQGATDYTYRDSNDVLTETDARGVTLFYEYDALNRKKAVHTGSLTGPKLAEWGYDTLPDGTPVPGLPVSSTRYANGAAYTTAVAEYDGANRVTRQQVRIASVETGLPATYEIVNTYRPDGELDTSTRPAIGGLPAETLRYQYDAHGLPTTLAGASTYVSGTTYTEFGEVEQVNLTAGGKWLRRDFRYELGTRRMARADTRRETGPSLVASVSYAYDPAGNITRISDAPDPASGATDTQCFRHDSLRRLTEAWTPVSGDCAAAPSAAALGGPAPYWNAWGIDKVGNRLTETRTAPGGAVTTSTYTYDPTGHRLRGVSTAGPTGTKVDAYEYDATGNTTTRNRAGVVQALEWDAEGHLAKATENGKVTSYVYDAAGERLIRRTPTGTTLYLGDTELQVDTAGRVTGTRYYSHAGQTVAMRSGRDGKLTWLVSDHHGTAEVAIEEGGDQVVRRARHDPYGASRGPAVANPAGERGFVGGAIDESTGLTHLGAREYDPGTGRFISVDPVVDSEDPQQMHGYAYANNSPISFTDPDGRAYVTRRVVSWRTTYQTVVRKYIQTVRVLVTLMVRLFILLFLGFFGMIWTPKTFTVIRTIVRYIKVVIKRLVKIVKLIRVYVKEKSHDKKKSQARLASLGSILDSIKSGLEEASRFLRGVQMISQMMGKLLLKCLWHCTLMGAREGLGLLARIKPIPGIGKFVNRGESWLIGKGVEGLSWLTGGSCNTQQGLRVCESGWMSFRGGTTYGDTYVTGDKNDVTNNEIEHEKVHRDKQWRKFGSMFGLMYSIENLRTWGDPCRNTYENEAGLKKGYPNLTC